MNAPADIRHIGAAVELHGAAEAAAAKPQQFGAHTQQQAPPNHAEHCLSQGRRPAPPIDQPSPPPPAGQDGKSPQDQSTSRGAGVPPRAPPPPPPPPVGDEREAANGQWSCLACTLINASGDAVCAACGAARGSQDLAIATAAQERELQVRGAERGW